MSDFNRGSEWKKWDFHVHTPASVLNNQFGDDWDNYVTILFKKAIEKGISAIGITDYFSVEGYKKIRTEYLDNNSKMLELFNEDEIVRINNILVFPNIELRLKKFIGTSAINFHVIFSNLINVNDLERNFLNELKFVYSENTEGSPETRSLTIENITLLGERLQSEHPPFREEGSTLFTGMKNVKVDDLDIVEVLNSKNSIFKNKYFLAIPSDEDLSSISWNSQDHNDRKLLIQKSHFLMSSNPNTVKWGLGQFNASVEEYITEFKSIKPTLWGSDAHDFDKLFEPDLNRLTWVKSDNTFEGIRQVLFEPERIKVQESLPSNKNAYQVIQELKFTDPSNTLFRNNFRIGLNQDLNSIIGGKSSGKSLLLYHIAKAVMNHEKFETIASTDGFQRYDELTTFELEAIWADGHISKLSDNDNKRPIIYIPQMYLNYMAEKRSRNEDFKQTIDDILKSNDGYSEYVDLKQREILNFEQRIDSAIKNYFLQISKLNDLQRELQQLGDKVAIELSVQTISTQLEALRNTSGFTQEEINLYTQLHESNKALDERRNHLIEHKALLNDLYQKTIQIQTKLPTFIEEEFSDIKYKYNQEALQLIISSTVNQINTNLTGSLGLYLGNYPFNQSEIDLEVLSINENIITNNNALTPLNEKIQNLEFLKLKEKELEVEQAKIIAINLKADEIRVQETRIDISPTLDLYETLFTCYIDIVTKHEEYKHISDSIELISEVSFNTDAFHRDFSEFITKNRNLQSIFSNHGFNVNSFSFMQEEHVANIRHIASMILENANPSISFNQGKSKQDIISALFKNYFDISYDLMQGNDRLGHMSPGKKGIILFQLFLHMSSSSDPILIDQPEDNLDNRTVYKELNDFIKSKKLKRQIIIVSHNSNLVVSTDSENVIVAHQNSNSEERPKFEYVNGALENTFIDSNAGHILEQQGIREHVCEILEGGVEAFKKRERRYNIN